MSSKNENTLITRAPQVEVVEPQKRAALVKSLEDRLHSIELTNNENLEIEGRELAATIVDTVVSLIPGADKAKRILETKEKIDEAVEKKKKELLFEAYLNKTDDIERVIVGIASLIADPRGNILYKKIESKMVSEIPSPEAIELLASSLRRVLESDLSEEFESHRAVITTITRMDLKSLLILKDKDNWPIARSKPTTMDATDAPDISNDWAFRIAKEYLKNKGVTDEAMIFHARTCFSELIQEGCIHAKSEINGNDFALITSFGERVLEYIAAQ
ncbi:MAG: hypothetical protein AB7F66_10990 [Bacteriovoracia bacterium]